MRIPAFYLSNAAIVDLRQNGAFSSQLKWKGIVFLKRVSYSFSLGAIRVALLARKVPSAISRAIEHLPTPRGAHSAGFFFSSAARLYLAPHVDGFPNESPANLFIRRPPGFV
jgi:hypothetical protein